MTEIVQEENKSIDNIQNNNNDKEKKIHKNKSNHFSRFLMKLYNILEDDENKNIIHWGDNGKYFIIENVHDFTEKILPKYYNHNNYSSFVRQLNMYDFHKKKTNSDGHTFQHNKFIKGQKELIKTILRKRKKDKNNIINTLIPLNMELVKYNNNYDINNYKNKIDGRENLSFDKHSLSLSLDEEKDNNQLYGDNNNIDNSLFEYNKKKYLPQAINDKYSAFHLKQNLIGQNGNNNINLNFNINNNNINNNIHNGNENKKITKKTINDLLNSLIDNVKENIKNQKKLNTKIDLLSNKNLEYINKNNSILDEIKSKSDYNKKFETVVCFILEIQKIKNEGTLKNILISKDLNNNHLQDNSNDVHNLEIINLAEPKKEINSIVPVPTNEFLKKKTCNNGIVEPFQTFLNKYMEKNKNRGLLTNEEMINNKNFNNINSNKNETKNIDYIIEKDRNKNNENQNNIEDSKIINNSILKDNIFEESKNRSPSFDFNSTIFKRKRSSSINSLFSNNANNFNDNFNNNDFIFKKDGDNNNTKNDNSIVWNNNLNYNNGNNLNKSFENDFNQNNNIERKDSLNNSLISFTDLGNKSSHIGDIFGGDNNSINFT